MPTRFSLPQAQLRTLSGSDGIIIEGETDSFYATHKAKSISKSARSITGGTDTGTYSGELWYVPAFESGLAFIKPNQYYVKIPASIGNSSNANNRSITDYAQQFLIAQIMGEVTEQTAVLAANEDDSYSFKDIWEFHPEIATVTITGEYLWIDENTLEPMNNGYVTVEPANRWAMLFEGADGSEVRVRDDETFVSSSKVEMTALQNVITVDDIKVYSGDFETDEFSTEAIINTDANPWRGSEVVDESTTATQAGYTFTFQLVRFYDNPETEADESQYRIKESLSFDGEEQGPNVYALDRWIWVGRPYDNQADAEAAFEGMEESKTEFFRNEVAIQTREEEEARRGEVVWETTLTGGPLSTKPGGEIDYSLSYSEAGKYLLKRGTLAIATIDASTDADAINQAQTQASSDANPEPIVYEVKSWREYIDCVEAYQLDSTKYPLPDYCPFWDVTIVGSYDWVSEGGHRPADPTKRSLMLDDKDDLGTPSGGVRLRLRAGYSVGFNLITENAHYFYANFEGVSGNWANVNVANPKGDSEVVIDPIEGVMVSPNDEVTFNLKARTHEDAYIEIDTDSEWSNISKFKIASLGEVITIDDPAKIDDETFLRVTSVEQYPTTDPDNPPNPDPDPTPDPNGNGETNGDLFAGVAIVGVVGLIIWGLVTLTQGGTNE